MDGPNPTDYIDHCMMEVALRKHFSCPTIAVESIAVEPANKVGAGYGSQMSRVKVTFRKGEGSAAQQLLLIVKADNSPEEMREMAEEWAIFKKEALVLAEVITTAHEALRKVEGDTFRPLAPICLHHGGKPRPFIVMDDLKAAGYRLAVADRPLDYRHCEVVMRAYARLHAGTAYALSKRPDFGDQLSWDSFAEEKAEVFMRPIIQCLFYAIADFVKKFLGYECYAAKFMGLTDTLMPVMREALKKKVQDTKLKVLVHGDCWKNNMMFKYSEGEAVDVRFVDFQLTHVSSPARDLVYFLHANVGLDVHEKLPSLLETYHSQLQASLRALGMAAAADAYPLEELFRDIEDLEPFALCILGFSGFTLNSELFGEKFERGIRDNNLPPDTFYGIYDNDYSRPFLQYMIPHFERNGLL